MNEVNLNITNYNSQRSSRVTQKTKRSINKSLLKHHKRFISNIDKSSESVGKKILKNQRICQSSRLTKFDSRKSSAKIDFQFGNSFDKFYNDYK